MVKCLLVFCPTLLKRQKKLYKGRLVQTFHLSQLVHEPTRGPHTLDLVFTNTPSNASARVLEKISDHHFVHCLVSFPSPDKTKTNKHIRNFAKADTDKMNRMLSDFAVPYQDSFSTRTTNKNWIMFRDKLKEMENTCIPKINMKLKTNAPWFTRDVKTSLNKKKRAYRKAAGTNSATDWKKYK